MHYKTQLHTKFSYNYFSKVNCYCIVYNFKKIFYLCYDYDNSCFISYSLRINYCFNSIYFYEYIGWVGDLIITLYKMLILSFTCIWLPRSIYGFLNVVARTRNLSLFLLLRDKDWLCLEGCLNEKPSSDKQFSFFV